MQSLRIDENSRNFAWAQGRSEEYLSGRGEVGVRIFMACVRVRERGRLK